MKKFALGLCLVLSASLAHAAETFGKLTLKDSSATSLKLAVDQFKENQSTPLLVKGTVQKVCEAEGCWMTLEDKGTSVRVFFKDHSFLVTQKLKGQTALAEGVLRKKVRSVADQKHLAKDAGAPEAEIAAIKADKTFYEFEATGVKAI